MRISRDWLTRFFWEWCYLAAIALAYEVVVFKTRHLVARADAHGRALYDIERTLHVAIEPWATRILEHAPRVVGLLAADWYGLAELVGVLGVLVWVWHRDFGAFKVARRQLYALNFIGVAAFMVWPSAPPRDAVRGVVDVVASLHGLANVHGHAAVAAVADEFGSFPSLHVATAVWCLWVVTKNSRKISAVVSWSVYLAVTSVVVVATGNHYVLDVVAGLPLGVGVCWVVTPAVALNRREWYRTVYLRSAHWARYAAARRADAHGACEECGAHGRLDVHHLTYARIGRERRRDTRVLCRNCHDRVHGVVAH